MKNRKIVQNSLVTVPIFVFACLLLPAVHAQTLNQTTQKLNEPAKKLGPNGKNQDADSRIAQSQTAQMGHYSVTLKISRSATFNGPQPEMIRDGGAPGDGVDGPNPPNRHVAAFIQEDDKPVEHANVEISYRTLLHNDDKWIMLPVARMHEGGKGLETTHFGNNVTLPTDSYDIRVTVNGTGPVTFSFPH